MRILSVISSIDLKAGKGCTPAWWQLHKALHEEGHELILTPYLGKDIESLWWRTYENPTYWESVLYKKISDWLDITAGSENGMNGLVKFATNAWTKRKWRRHLDAIITEESPDVVLFFNIPLNQISGLPTEIREKHGLPVLFYDGDMPTILPEYVESRGFQFNYYDGADLSEYDAFLVNSEGVTDRLREMGARNVHPIHYGADPGLYKPVNVSTEYDVAFFGSGAQFREDHTRYMITEPARELSNRKFIVGGRGYEIDLGPVQREGWIPINGFREFCGRAKINLNITRKAHREVYKSSTSRPFELAAMGCCVISDSYHGLEEWFDIGSEMFVVEDKAEAIELYEWLLDDDEKRQIIGERARERVLSNHTFGDRATHLTAIIDRYRERGDSSEADLKPKGIEPQPTD